MFDLLWCKGVYILKTIKEGEVFQFAGQRFFLHVGFDDEVRLMDDDE